LKNNRREKANLRHKNSSQPKPTRAGIRSNAAKNRRRLWGLLAMLALFVAVSFFWRMTAPQGDFNELLSAGVSAIESGEYDLAARLLDAAIRKKPEHGEALLYRGFVARDLGQNAAALHFWRRVPDMPAQLGSKARYLEGVVLIDTGFASRGEEALLRAAELNPNRLPTHERLLELYVVQIRRNKIRTQLHAIRLLRPWKLQEVVLYSIATERVSDVGEGIRQMKRFLAAEPDAPLNAFALARYLLDDEKFMEAETVARRLLKTTLLPSGEHNPRAVGLLAEILMRQEKMGAAANILADVGALESPSFWFWRACGRYWLLQGDWRRAADCLAQAAILNPEDLTTAHQLGAALGRLGEANANFHLRRAGFLDNLLRQASRIPNRKAGNKQGLYEIVMDVGKTLLELERSIEAAYWFEQAIVLNPQSSAARRELQRVAALLRAPMPPTTKLQEHLPALAASPQELHHLLEQVRPKNLRSQPSDAASQVASSPSSHIRFRDIHASAGLDFQYFNGLTEFKYLLESMGGGVAVLDYDLDGWPDLYFTQGCALPVDLHDRTHTDRLYRNLGDGRFADVTALAGLGSAGYGQGCTAADYDNDGDPDLVVANYGKNIFYRNNGDGSFSEITDIVGVGGDAWSSSVGFADFDLDGNLDLYVVNYVDALKVCRGSDGRIATCDPQNFNGVQDRLYRNLGNGFFEDITESCGIVASDGKGLGLVLADLDNDHRVDIYVANDGAPNFLFHNVGAAGRLQFQEVGALAGVATDGDGRAEGGMGIACADFQNDGRLDLYVSNFSEETNTLYQNAGGLFFQDVTRRSGMAGATKPLVGFGVQAADFDQDGMLDLIVANGNIDDFRFRNELWKMPALLFRGRGSLRFSDVSKESGAYFQRRRLGRAVALLDWDQDQDPDVVIVHQDAPAALLSNETRELGNRLVVRLHGVASNRDARGARVRVQTGKRTQIFEVTSGDGFYCSNERCLYIGLGDAEQVDRLEIRWSSGTVDTLQNISANQSVELIEGNQWRHKWPR